MRSIPIHNGDKNPSIVGITLCDILDHIARPSNNIYFIYLRCIFEFQGGRTGRPWIFTTEIYGSCHIGIRETSGKEVPGSQHHHILTSQSCSRGSFPNQFLISTTIRIRRDTKCCSYTVIPTIPKSLFLTRIRISNFNGRAEEPQTRDSTPARHIAVGNRIPPPLCRIQSAFRWLGRLLRRCGLRRCCRQKRLYRP